MNSNIKTKIAVDIGRTIVESWISEDSSMWYRKWSDGWIEQGGRTTTSTVNLPIEFTNTGYVVVASGQTSTGNEVISDRTLTSINIILYGNDNVNYISRGLLWYACGY